MFHYLAYSVRCRELIDTTMFSVKLGNLLTTRGVSLKNINANIMTRNVPIRDRPNMNARGPFCYATTTCDAHKKGFFDIVTQRVMIEMGVK